MVGGHRPGQEQTPRPFTLPCACQHDYVSSQGFTSAGSDALHRCVRPLCSSTFTAPHAIRPRLLFIPKGNSVVWTRPCRPFSRAQASGLGRTRLLGTLVGPRPAAVFALEQTDAEAPPQGLRVGAPAHLQDTAPPLPQWLPLCAPLIPSAPLDGHLGMSNCGHVCGCAVGYPRGFDALSLKPTGRRVTLACAYVSTCKVSAPAFAPPCSSRSSSFHR